MIKSIDISSNNTKIDFTKVKNDGIQLVWIKATEGATWTSPTLQSQYEGAKAVGLKVGFYHFLSDRDGTEQAKYFLSVVSNYKSDVPYCIDSEDRNVNYALEKTNDFVNYVKTQGYKIILYTDESYFQDELHSTTICDLWCANWQKQPQVKYVGWQYTNEGKVNGVNEGVDVSNFDDSILLNQVKETIKQNVFNPISTHDVNLNFGGNEMKNYKNGSTTENVYADYNCTTQIGSLDTWESCQCVWCDGTRAIVKFKIDGTSNYKTGFVRYVGGVQ